MELTDPVKQILSYYESDNPGTKANLARILLQGRLGGTGRLLILPVDQGVEHGPARSFAPTLPFDKVARMNLRLSRVSPSTVSGQPSSRCQARLR